MSYGLRDLDGQQVELCDECGFDGRDERDLARSFEAASDSLQRLAIHADAERRPEAETWSGSEYADHCVEVASETLAMVARATRHEGWTFELSVRGAMVHLLHDLEHHVWDIRRGYAALALRDGSEVVTSRR